MPSPWHADILARWFSPLRSAPEEPESEQQESAPAAPEPQEPAPVVSGPLPVEAALLLPAAPARLDAQQIADCCIARGIPELTAVLVCAGIDDASAIQSRIDTAAEIQALIARAHGVQPQIPMAIADILIAEGASITTTKAIIGVMLPVLQSPEIFSHRAVADPSDDQSWGDVYEKAKSKSK